MAYGELGPTHHSIEDLSWTARDRQPHGASSPPTRSQTRAGGALGREHAGPASYLRIGRVHGPGGHARGRALRARQADQSARRQRRHHDRHRHDGARGPSRRPTRSRPRASGPSGQHVDDRAAGRRGDPRAARRDRAASSRWRRHRHRRPRRRRRRGRGAARSRCRCGSSGVTGVRPDRQRPRSCSTTSASTPRASPPPPGTCSTHEPQRSSSPSTRAPAPPRPCSSTPTGAIVAAASVPSSVAATPGPAGSSRIRGRDLGQSRRGRRRACLDGDDAAAVAAVGLSDAARVAAAVGPRDRGAARPDARAGRTSARRRLRAAARGTPEVGPRLSGLPLDPMFSATKARWLLDRRRRATQRAASARSTAFLRSRLGGEHVIEIGNALADPAARRARPATGARAAGAVRHPARACCRDVDAVDRAVPSVHGPSARWPTACRSSRVIGDSHAALFAHGAAAARQVKATYGTGSSVMSLGSADDAVGPGLCLTIAWADRGTARHAAEGNIRSTGATLTWLGRAVRHDAPTTRGSRPAPTATASTSCPAFAGLGAPWWDDERGRPRSAG